MQPAVLALHHAYADAHPPIMSFDENRDLPAQTKAAREKFIELLGLPEKTVNSVPMVEYVSDADPRFDEIRFQFESEPNLFVPAHLLLPKGVYKTGKKLPVVIGLQGHASGMHISLGRAKYPGDEEDISGGDRDFCIQAVALGYAAVAMEQRGFGELDGTVSPGANRCQQNSTQALLLGRTMIGERAHDVSCLIDTLGNFSECDVERVSLMGNSGGGTATFYTACVEPRVKIAMPSCAFCSLHDSIFAQHHCVCNYIPKLYQYFEMGDLAMLIAPRPLIVVCGKDDSIFPLEGVKREFATVEKIYRAAGVPENCAMIVGDAGHRFYAKPSWPVFAKMLTKI
ncbi:MAG: alpha/beta hydrolase family protein [Clostridiaceae bacterium]|nr:alpha/beta hydrolase family protein [Clostridiaceae bacterium]